MKKPNGVLSRKTVLRGTTAAALGATLALPKKALAASPETKTAPASNVNPAATGLTIIQPTRVDASTLSLLRIADRAMSDSALAEQIFRDPDAVAAQYNLSKNEKTVLRHMTRAQFEAARADAAHVVATRRAKAKSMRMPAEATNARLIAERMVVGRAILAAVGRSYLDAANAHDCCPWNKAIELGVRSDPAAYSEVFK